MFLTIYTRHLASRPKLFAHQKESLAKQTCQDFEHVVNVDAAGRGFAYAQRLLHDFEPAGDYVWVFDDDDELICPNFIQCLKNIAEIKHPDVIMVRMDYAGQLLPDALCWRGTPHEGHITQENYIVSRQVWMDHRHAYSERYQADYDFIADVWKSAPAVEWHDCIAIRDQAGRGLGRPDERA